MTNSAKQTKKSKPGSPKAPAKPAAKAKAAPASAPAEVLPEALPAYASGDFWAKTFSKNPARVIGLAVLLVGCLFILHINRYHLTVPVVILWLGWAGVIFTARFLWWSGIAMASQSEDGDAVMDVSVARLRELRDEKKILVRAIKEIEFDRDLGKMSSEDAKEIMRFYRARAIEVIKEIDGQDESDLTVPQRIERDLQARLAVETQASPSRQETPKQKAARIITARANAKAAADAKAAVIAEETASEAEDADAEDAEAEDADAAGANAEDGEAEDGEAEDAKAEKAKAETTNKDEPSSDPPEDEDKESVESA